MSCGRRVVHSLVAATLVAHWPQDGGASLPFPPLTLTPGADLRGDLLIGLPLTLLLPTIGHNTEYKSRWRESQNAQVDNTMQEEEEQEEEEVILDKEPLLSRLHTFFKHLGVHEQGCRNRAICEIVQSNQQFAPLGDYLSSLLRRPKSVFWGEEGEEKMSLAWIQSVAAAKMGEVGDCSALLEKCDHPVSSMLNIPSLRLWQLLAEHIALRIEDF